MKAKQQTSLLKRQKRLFVILGMTTLATLWSFNVGCSEQSNVEAQPAKDSSSEQSQAVKPNDLDRGLISEAFGHIIVKNLDNPGFKFDIDKVIKGMQDEVAGKASPLTDEEYERAVTVIQEKIFTEMSENNLKEANAFLEKNAKEPSVVELVPGKLQYKTVKEGEGAEVKPHSTPTIHYTGRYIDGTVFGSSVETNDPVNLPLDQTILGFNKGLIGMKEGEKRILFIHPDYGYGANGQLPPNSLLIFDVELLKADSTPSPTVESSESPQQ